MPLQQQFNNHHFINKPKTSDPTAAAKPVSDPVFLIPYRKYSLCV